jgi:hypothetical protein
MCWRLAAVYSSGTLSAWHIIFAMASFFLALPWQRRGRKDGGRSSSSQGGAGGGFGVKVTKKADDSLFESSGAEACGAQFFIII